MTEATRPGPTVPKWAGRLAAIAALLFGAYATFHYSRGLWNADPDVAVPVALWRGVQQHGLAFAASWGSTVDNWLFTLVPLDAALLSLAPHTPELIVVSGWLIFLGSVALAGVIAAQVAGRDAGLRLAAVLSFANYQALGAAGFLSYPVTHNVSMLWGLAGIALSIAWVRRGWVGALVAAGAAIALDGLSDPWAVAAVTLPVAVVACGLGLHERDTPEGRRALWLAAVAALSALVARTRGFGGLAFLKPAPVAFAAPDDMAHNAYWGFRALAAIFNIAPHANPEAPAVYILSGVAALAVLAGVTVVALQQLREAKLCTRLTIGVCIVSCGAIATAYLVGQWPRGLLVGRYLQNVYFLGGILAAWALARGWGGWRAAPRIAAAAWVGLFMLSGALSFPRLWLGLTPARDNREILALSDLLQREGLRYGYGAYWGAHALSMEWLTQGRLVIRPVTFRQGRVAPRTAEATPYWYRRADEPPGLREWFIVVAYDGEECPTVEGCVEAAAAQFGPASRTIPYADGLVMVWPRSLVGGFGPALR